MSRSAICSPATVRRDGIRPGGRQRRFNSADIRLGRNHGARRREGAGAVDGRRQVAAVVGPVGELRLGRTEAPNAEGIRPRLGPRQGHADAPPMTVRRRTTLAWTRRQNGSKFVVNHNSAKLAIPALAGLRLRVLTSRGMYHRSTGDAKAPCPGSAGPVMPSRGGLFALDTGGPRISATSQVPGGGGGVGVWRSPRR